MDLRVDDRPQEVPSASTNGDHTPSFSKSPPHQSKTIEYTSSAPQPPTTHAQNGEEDEDVPTHLYEKLPKHMLENGKPDYLRMILMCESAIVQPECSELTVAKVYTSPLNLQETPLTLAVNLSARLGCEVS